MVSKNEVIAKFNHSLHVVWVMLFQQQQQLCLNCCLIVVLLLVFNQLNCHKLLVLVVQTLYYLSEGSFSDDFNKLEPVRNVVSFLYPVVSLLVIKSIIDQPL